MAGREDTISPDQYSPNKDKVMYESPKWTFPGKPKDNRPKSTMHARPGKKPRGFTGDFGELGSYNDPPKFGDGAKGLKFGADKPAPAKAQKRGRTNTKTASGRQPPSHFATLEPSPMTAVVFEEEAGPEIQVESVNLKRDTQRERATKSAKKAMAAPAPQTP